MGLIPKADITMVKYAPMGDPVELRVHSYELTLRRRHRINPRKVRYQRILISFNLPVLPVHRHSGEIPHMAAGTGKLIKQRRLSAILVSRQGKGIINIVDATNIERNLYLTMQLMELDVPMVLALNMMDE